MRPLALALLVGLAVAGAATASSHVVDIENFAFAPSTLQVEAGTEVTWTNKDAAPHTASSTDGPAEFDSGHLTQGQSFSFTFTTPGTYEYRCDYHSDMRATITVTEASGGGGGDGGNGDGDGTGGGGNGGNDTSGDLPEGGNGTPGPLAAGVALAGLAAAFATRRR